MVYSLLYAPRVVYPLLYAPRVGIPPPYVHNGGYPSSLCAQRWYVPSGVYHGGYVPSGVYHGGYLSPRYLSWWVSLTWVSLMVGIPQVCYNGGYPSGVLPVRKERLTTMRRVVPVLPWWVEECAQQWQSPPMVGRGMCTPVTVSSWVWESMGTTVTYSRLIPHNLLKERI